MESLAQCATGPAATATHDPAAQRRVSVCSSYRSALLPLDGLLPDPSRNLHGLVSARFAAERSRTMGASS